MVTNNVNKQFGIRLSLSTYSWHNGKYARTSAVQRDNHFEKLAPFHGSEDSGVELDAVTFLYKYLFKY